MACNAQSRNTELVKTEPDVRKARTCLLIEVGALAALAKKINHTSISEITEIQIEVLGEAIQTRIGRVVNRANQLLEIATQLMELRKENHPHIYPTPLANDVTEFSSETSETNQAISGSIKGGQESTATSNADSLGSTTRSSSDNKLENK